MPRKPFFIIAALFAASQLIGGETGVVNFASCLTESKQGKKEQENFDSLRNQMASLIENTENELKELSSKFEDAEYVDALSPKAEEELKIKYQSLQEDLGRYQNQFYQVLNHANYQMIQKMNTTIATAAEQVAKQKKLDYVINKEACFYTRPDLDVTDSIIEQMDRSFDLNAQKKKLSDAGEDLPEGEELSLDQAG